VPEQTSGRVPEEPPTTRRSVGSGAALTGVRQVATALLGGLLGIFVARLLGPEGTGAFNVVLSALVLLITLSTLGLGAGAIYFVSNRRWEPGEAFRQLQIASMLVGLLGAGIGLAAATLLADTAFQGIPVGLVAAAFAVLPFALSWHYTSSVALGGEHYETYAVAPVVQSLAALVLAVLAAPFAGLAGAVGAVAGSHIISSAWLWIWATKRLPSPPPGWLGRTGRDVARSLRFGIQTHVPVTLQYLNARADLFILNAVAAQATVGRYAIAVAVTELGLMLPRALTTVVFPRIAALDDARDPGEQLMVIRKSVRHAVLLMPLTVAALSIGLVAIPLVYGWDFSPAIGMGFVLVPGIALLGAANVLGATVVGKGRPRYFLYSGIAVTPPTLLLYVLLVPPLEGYGAALASTISYAGLAGANLFFFRRVTKGKAVGRLLPTRDELDDYKRMLARARSRIRPVTDRP
jgi:O-antigen/teichoic acid export membrane protein